MAPNSINQVKRLVRIPRLKGLQLQQGGEQSALDRMTQIGTYKVLLSLRKTIASNPGGKATNLLGRTWAVHVFPEVREQLDASTANSDEQMHEVRKAFFDGFQEELGASCSTSFGSAVH